MLSSGQGYHMDGDNYSLFRTVNPNWNQLNSFNIMKCKKQSFEERLSSFLRQFLYFWESNFSQSTGTLNAPEIKNELEKNTDYKKVQLHLTAKVHWYS